MKINKDFKGGYLKSKNKKHIVKAGEFRRIAKITLGTLLYYSDEGLLMFTQTRRRAFKYYDVDLNLKRLERIRELQKQKLTLAQIKGKMNILKHK